MSDETRVDFYAEERARKDIKSALSEFIPDSEHYGAPVVHRDHIANAFEAGMRAAVHFNPPMGEIAAEFRAYLEEEFCE